MEKRIQANFTQEEINVLSRSSVCQFKVTAFDINKPENVKPLTEVSKTLRIPTEMSLVVKCLPLCLCQPKQERREGIMITDIQTFSCFQQCHYSTIVLLATKWKGIMGELSLSSWVECWCSRAVSCFLCDDTGGSCTIIIRPRRHLMVNLLISSVFFYFPLHPSFSNTSFSPSPKPFRFPVLFQ